MNLRFVVGRGSRSRRAARTDDDGLRGARRAGRRDRPERARSSRTGAACPEPHAGRATAGGASRSRPPPTRRRSSGPTGRGRSSPPRTRAGVTAFGSFSTDAEAVAVANSKGVRAAERRTSSQLLTVHMSPDGGSGYAEARGVDATTIDAAALGPRGGREGPGQRQRGRRSTPGDYPVVLEAYAVVDILDMLGYLGFSALAVQEGRSFMEPGRRDRLATLVTIVDDGADPAGLPAAFDYEGVAKQRVTLLEAGVCRDVVYDSQTAARDGVAVHRPRPAGARTRTARSRGNMVMAGGDDDPRRAHRRAGPRAARDPLPLHQPGPPEEGDRHRMTRDGTFLVEGGRIVGPVRNFRFTQSYLDALAGVEALWPGAARPARLPRRQRRAGGSGSPTGRSPAPRSTEPRRDGRRPVDPSRGSRGRSTRPSCGGSSGCGSATPSRRTRGTSTA